MTVHAPTFEMNITVIAILDVLPSAFNRFYWILVLKEDFGKTKFIKYCML